MKPRLLFLPLALLFATLQALAISRDAEWKKVDEAARAQLPKTALEHLEPLIQSALADKAYAEALKAITQKIDCETAIQGGQPEERILRLQAERDKAPAPLRPLLETLLAHAYWQYYQNNRWSFMQRSQTTSAPGADLKAWDLARILAEIDKHFCAALENAQALQSIPIADYDALLTRSTLPDTYRPTLFDFIAHEALAFYSLGEQASTEAEESFELAASSPIFADAADFTKWQLPSSDHYAPKLKALALYQALLNFHARDKDRSAFLDADLARLNYGFVAGVGDDRVAAYKEVLTRFIDKNAKHEITSRALACLGTVFNNEGDPVKAHALETRGLTAFPGTLGADQCFNLLQHIEAKSSSLETEFVWNTPWPTLNVSYRNVTKVYFRAIAYDFEEYLRQSERGVGQVTIELKKTLLNKKPTLEWTADLPPTTDFKQRTEKLKAPESLKPGFYFILSSHAPDFTANDNSLGARFVWVSRLALILRARSDGTPHSGFVLRGESGEPVAGAQIRIWKHEGPAGYKPLAPTLTDLNGCFKISAGDQPVILLAQESDQSVSNAHDIFLYENSRPQHTGTQTVFFTDRVLYRPGQSIQYKGVSVKFDQEQGKYETSSNTEVTVVFNDNNGQEIARATHRTNAFGSFSGVFTAPADRLTGSMSLQVVDGSGLTRISVEEYKRPKFQVELSRPTLAAKLNETVTLTGRALAYTGAPLGGARVKWRVERGVQWPVWCWWWRPLPAKSIAHGTAVSAQDGSFSLQFTALPDPAAAEKLGPVFNFSIHADVTDSSGETRSVDQYVNVGYTALAATLAAAEWQSSDKPVELAIRTTSLDGQPLPSSGTVSFHELRQPSNVERGELNALHEWWAPDQTREKFDPANPDTWETAALVTREKFRTDDQGMAQVSVSLKPGLYRAALDTTDAFGKEVTSRQTLRVFDTKAGNCPLRLPNVFVSRQDAVQPGDTFTALWGTGYDKGRAFVELESQGKLLASYWTAADSTQSLISQPVTETLRGGFTLRVTYVRENRAYFNQKIIHVPWKNKELNMRWESFRSKLSPGQKETWTAVVTGPDAKAAAVEMVASLYDASLDQFQHHSWPRTFSIFRQEPNDGWTQFVNQSMGFNTLQSWRFPASRDAQLRYRSFPADLMSRSAYGEETIALDAFMVATPAPHGYTANASIAGTRIRTELKDIGSAITNVSGDFLKRIQAKSTDKMLADAPTGEGFSAPEDVSIDGLSQPNLDQVATRTNLNETAFFFPQLVSDADGVVRMVFTMPEALTEWKFLGFAHDTKLRTGYLTDKVVTSKDLMVEPNPPRFLREGDEVEFTVKVTNRSTAPQDGTVRLSFLDTESLRPVDAALGNVAREQKFSVPAGQARSFSWRLKVPENLGVITYKAVAATEKFSDGEEGAIPVLSRRVLLTESLPLSLRGAGTRQFSFDKLLASGTSQSLQNQSLTVQMCSQPAWYAVQALPYLMEFPHECSEQVFNRFYANALAHHIATANPKIRRVFDLWKNTPALESPLQKNQQLKSVLIEDTPWLRQAKNDTEAQRNLGLLFDENRLTQEGARTLKTLTERQLSDGQWSWFPGGWASEYITLYITSGFGRLRHLGVDVDLSPALKALDTLDASMAENYRRLLLSKNQDSYVPSYTDALFLYGRSFFLKDHPVAEQHRAALEFLLRQTRKLWPKVSNRQSLAQLALALQRFDDTTTAQAIVKSLKEYSVNDSELGMFWRDTEAGWWWYQAPIETQVFMIEAFAEITQDQQAVEDCKVWLLKQKQTQDWHTTKATADAIYGLLLNGTDLLSSDALTQVTLDGVSVPTGKTEAGTGFYEKAYLRDEIKPAMGHISVTKPDAGVSWGSVHWQYLEDLSKVTPHEGTPLKLKKTLWIKETTAKGQVLKPVTGPVSVGDELVVRLELRTDRDMEFVHLKDQRGSGTEPVKVLSGYKYQDGLAYYESTRDTATHFYIDYLRKGTYVFEYSLRVQLKGSYQTGLAEIQCMYAPAFNSHSESLPLDVH